jgi:hemoglobin-like flavoprotein
VDSRTVSLARESYAPLAVRATELADRFFENLFSRQAAVRPFFPADVSEQKRQLSSTLQTLLDSAQKLETIAPALAELGKKYAAAGAQPVHYSAVSRTLIDTMREMSGLTWEARYTRAWTGIFAAVSKAMIKAATAKAPVQAKPPARTTKPQPTAANKPTTKPAGGKSKRAA